MTLAQWIQNSLLFMTQKPSHDDMGNISKRARTRSRLWSFLSLRPTKRTLSYYDIKHVGQAKENNLTRIYFAVNEEIFNITDGAKNPDADIKRCLCICDRFFPYLLDQEYAKNDDNSIFIRALSHVSDRLPNERIHVTLKTCRYKFAETENNHDHTEGRHNNGSNNHHSWEHKPDTSSRDECHSSGDYHLYTDVEYCEGEFYAFGNEGKENGWAKQLRKARYRGTLVWDGERHWLRKERQQEQKQQGQEEQEQRKRKQKDICNRACIHPDSFTEIVNADRFAKKSIEC